MIKLPFVLLFTAMTALSWGVYGILLHNGTELLGHSSLRAFIGVGIAYFLIAVLIPAIWLGSKKEKGYWSVTGAVLSTLAGAVGALGALGVILAVAFKGQPLYVMPIVFGGAPVVNTLVTSLINKSFAQIKPMFIFGMVLVAIGMVGVLTQKPSAPAKSPAAMNSAAKTGNADKKTEAATTTSAEAANPSDSDKLSSTAAAPTEQADAPTSADAPTATIEPKEVSPSTTSPQSSSTHSAASESNPLAVAGSILLAVFCWGAYGPVLHIGQTKMGGSRLRPFCCVGIAYFVIAVAVPVMILMTSSDSVHITLKEAVPGMLWSILAGTAGAVGALGIILAFNYGGKPVFVMPLVFGFAPVVNTLTSMAIAGKLSSITPSFAGALLIGIAGAVTVLVFAPKAKPHGSPSAPNSAPSAAKS